MDRRAFLFGSVSALGSAPRITRSPRITRIALAPIEGRFHKLVAMNSYDKAAKGETYTNWLLRIRAGEVEGVGVGRAPDEAYVAALRTLVGADPLALYETSGGRITGRAPAHAAVLAKYRHLDGPLFDLVGKLTRRPCWQLLGPAARDRVEAYDGTLYFSDVLHPDRGVAAVVEEAREAVASGYTGVKLKAGRGWKWMEKDAGLARDVAVVRGVRQAVGPRLKVLADPNDGYRGDFDRAWRFLSETRDANLYWIEEIFPEDVAWYTRLKQNLREAGMKTLIADGENFQSVEAFEPYLKPQRLIDVLQMDTRVGGFLDNVRAARLAASAGAVVVPHNWASQYGMLMALHLAKAVANIPAVEDDRSRLDALALEDYSFKDGYWSVSDAPGLGVHVLEDVYTRKYKAREVVV